jgi:hypothetical protein
VAGADGSGDGDGGGLEFTFPPIVKGAMEGAPGGFGGREDRQRQIQGSFPIRLRSGSG